MPYCGVLATLDSIVSLGKLTLYKLNPSLGEDILETLLVTQYTLSVTTLGRCWALGVGMETCW